jgi:hypothetical protein
MSNKLVSAITEILIEKVNEEKDAHPMRHSPHFLTACKIGKAIKEQYPDFDLDAFEMAIGNEKY